MEESSASASSSSLNPSAPVFVPQQRQIPEGQQNLSGVTAASSSSSSIFSGGVDFLAKYRTQQADGSSKARVTSQGNKHASEKTGTAPVTPSSSSTAAPDRMHVQLNSMLIHARHPDKILQVVEQNFDHFNAVNLITALHRLATVVVSARKGTVRRDPRFKRLINRLSETLRNAEPGVLKPQDLSNAAWALTKLGMLNAVLFTHLSDHIMRTIHNFEPVNLSMTLWAFARSGFLDNGLFKAAAVEVKQQLPDFEPQQIANTTWAMAKSGYIDEEVFQSAADLALQKLSQFQPMNFSMLLYSFSLAKLPHPRLFDEVGRKCTVEALSATTSSAPHMITNLALAFSDAGMVNANVFDAIGRVASTSLHEFRPQQIAVLAQAFANADQKHDRLFNKMSEEVVFRMSEFKREELQEVLQSYKSLQLSTASITRAMEGQQSSKNWLLATLSGAAVCCRRRSKTS